MLLMARAILLVLDEPTNHLDVETIEVLEDAIEAYDGTVILVSHDRAMLRALATKVWVLHERHVTEFDGTFGEWEVASEERAHAAAVRAAEEVARRRVDEKRRGSRRGEGGGGEQKGLLRGARTRAGRAEQGVGGVGAAGGRAAAPLGDFALCTAARGRGGGAPPCL